MRSAGAHISRLTDCYDKFLHDSGRAQQIGQENDQTTQKRKEKKRGSVEGLEQVHRYVL